MRLDGLERHRHGSSRLHRLDARIKLIAALALIVGVIAMPIAAWRGYGAAGLLLAFLIGLSGIPPREIGRRWLGLFVLVSFLAVMIAYGHPERARLGLPAVAASILIKNGLALMTMIVLAGTTPFPGCCRECGGSASRSFWLRRSSSWNASAMSWSTRSIAWPPRGGPGPSAAAARSSWSLLGGLIGMLFLRTLERGERVHDAMVARGWTGTIRSLDD